ncbi:peptidylprolyl isomerase [Devosia lucknowensis]|uniref:Peptidyl-prolyl cis-trans isomerase n=1 Tax=Devosia lucknowensis TaxID=1096929 RepID=A0A1Y6GA17_9HYPH|nr:peptidylprolyl isomerase [Devosia lucknowensis]SMQ85558.1 peptidylprolyl isomerase [Devosia lucknowensis]
MTTAATGDIVRIHYSGRLVDGTQFDSSEGRAPLEFTLGQGQVIRGLEQHVAGMEAGAKSTVTIPVDDAYGPRRDEAIQQLDRAKVPAGIDLKVGSQLQARTADGGMLPITVVGLDEQSITVDANHPLAGQDLVFDVEVVEVVKAA